LWDRLLKRYRKLQTEIKEVRDEMKKIGDFRPQTVLRMCDTCGAGPFGARELREHKCVKEAR
jgi:hypothetical protein